MPGAQIAPAASHANESEHTSVVTTVTPETPGIPYTMVLTAYIALSPVSRAFLPPSPARSSPHELDASVGASGPHDFAVRFMRRSSKAPKRPPHPALNVYDDRETPLERRRDRDSIVLLLPRRQEQFRKIGSWAHCRPLRSQGPIRRGLASWHGGRRLFRQPAAVVLGPAFRRDDERVGVPPHSSGLKFQQ
jgi:hypothetical protein